MMTLVAARHEPAAMARANCFASNDPATFFYPDRQWQGVNEVPYTFLINGTLAVDRRA
jgi:hypothetical protein